MHSKGRDSAARRSCNQKCMRPAVILIASSKGIPVLSALFHHILLVESAQSAAQRTQGSAENHREIRLFFRPVLIFFSIGSSVFSVAFLRAFCVKFRKARRKCARPANISTASGTDGRTRTQRSGPTGLLWEKEKPRSPLATE